MAGPAVTIFYCLSPEEDRQSHALLYRSAGIFSGLSAEELGPLETNPWGKPSFSLRPDLHFSITHSQDWWLCGFSSALLQLFFIELRNLFRRPALEDFRGSETGKFTLGDQ